MLDIDDEVAFAQDEAVPGRGAALTRLAGVSTRLDAMAGATHPDPAQFGWPPTLAIEIAMHVAPTKDICEAYDIDRARWREIAANPVFVAELAGAMEMLRQDGMAFKARARLQSMELLKTSWAMIHDAGFPPAVRADLLKFTVNSAGLNDSLVKKSGDVGLGGGTVANGFHIAIHLNV